MLYYKISSQYLFYSLFLLSVFTSLNIKASNTLSVSKQYIHIVSKTDTISFQPEHINILKDQTLIIDYSQLNEQPPYTYELINQNTLIKKETTRNSIYISNIETGEYKFILHTGNDKCYYFDFHIHKNTSKLIRYIISIILFLSLLIFLFIYFIKKRLNQILRKRFSTALQERLTLSRESRKKSRKVVNQLTHDTPEKYAEHDRIRSKKHPHVTVLFADIQGFTKIVEHLNPELLIDELDKFFFKFDEVVEKYGIEKIKTIGDAYMCAGGIPEKNKANPIEVVMAALDMQSYMKSFQKEKEDNNQEFWELRIGIHTGSVISGLVGRKKISFDIWGDTVNIASRMESSGIASEINITGITYQLIKDFFVCQYRGKMPIKYKGETDMYFVKNILPELSINGNGTEPNSLFFTRLQAIKYADIEETVINQLQKDLPENMYYHNIEHTLDVITQVEVIARGESVTEEELLLLKTAALLHDTGFLIEYHDHEESSMSIARELLPKFKYTEDQVETIAQLIEVTKIKSQPKTNLEMIIRDADLDYLGRPDFITISENLLMELSENGRNFSHQEWIQMQYSFLLSHKYYTETAKRLRQVNKERQLEKLKLLID